MLLNNKPIDVEYTSFFTDLSCFSKSFTSLGIRCPRNDVSTAYLLMTTTFNNQCVTFKDLDNSLLLQSNEKLGKVGRKWADSSFKLC